MFTLENALSDEPSWKRPIPVCGSLYPLAIITVSSDAAVQFLVEHNGISGFLWLILFVIGGALYSFEIHSIRIQRNRAAGELNALVTKCVRNDEVVPTDYSLFLRRFGSEDRPKSIMLPLHPIAFDEMFLPNTFEAFLSNQMHGWCPLVGLGRVEEAAGAGKITSSDVEWQSNIRILLRGANIIFLVPALSCGTIWETREILSDPSLRSKTVLLVPPRYFGHAIETEWNAIRAAYLREFSWALPEYKDYGLAWSLSDYPKVKKAHFIGRTKESSQIRTALALFGLLDDHKLSSIEKDYPTRGVSWNITFLLIFGFTIAPVIPWAGSILAALWHLLLYR